MCGIFGAINKLSPPVGISVPTLVEATSIIDYRGPDDSGYFLWSKEGNGIYADDATADSSRLFHNLEGLPDKKFQLALGHRRLSILDLSPSGHQPMEFGDLVLVFNGEVYNYIEIRKELQAKGMHFKTQSDTEVILQAWRYWGVKCLARFNGMFAFLLFDKKKKKLFAVRDRFGVKPLYFTEKAGYLAFASEVKQLRVLPEYSFDLDQQIAFDYLRYGFLDHQAETFELGINQLDPGHYLEYDLKLGQYAIRQWYVFNPQPWEGSLEEAEEEFRYLLKDAVRLRLRSDVPLGSALSGGLDSSAIVCLMSEILDETGSSDKVLVTVTSCSEDKRFDETHFAEIINKHTNSLSHKVFPDFDKLMTDLDRVIWHMDYPFGSTSQFSQWSVFERAKQAGLKVMIDGQGADEQLAGYGGNDLALYTGLFRSGKFKNLFREAAHYKKIHGKYPVGFLLGAFQHPLPSFLQNQIPAKWRPSKEIHPDWIKHNGFKTKNFNAASLKENLTHQIHKSPLPSLLRYEDRNSMASSVESRTPFMDYRIMEFSLGLPEEFVYRNGDRKFILRNSFRGIVPDAILDRRDKMGFVSAEERWIKEDGKDWFFRNITGPMAGNVMDFFNSSSLESFISEIQGGKRDFTYEPWRVLNFKMWINMMDKQHKKYNG